MVLKLDPASSFVSLGDMSFTRSTAKCRLHTVAVRYPCAENVYMGQVIKSDK